MFYSYDNSRATPTVNRKSNNGAVGYVRSNKNIQIKPNLTIENNTLNK